MYGWNIQFISLEHVNSEIPTCPPYQDVQTFLMTLLICSKILRELTQVHRVSSVCSNPSLADRDPRQYFLRANTSIALETGSLRTWPPLCSCCCPALAQILSAAALSACLSEPTASSVWHSIDALFFSGCSPLLWIQERGTTLFFYSDSSEHSQVLL